VKTLPPEEAEKLRSMGLKRYGGPPDAVAMADEPGADLPEACVPCSGCGNPSPSGVGPSVNLRMARVVERALRTLDGQEIIVAPMDPATGEPAVAVPADAVPLEDAVVEEVLRALVDG
jgi:hypothetical protein